MMAPHPDGVTLNDYADGSLPLAARDEIAAHVETCATCRATVDGLRAVREAARRLPPLQPRQEAWKRIEHAIGAGGLDRRSPRWPWLAAAAAVLLAALVGFKLTAPGRPAPAPDSNAAAAPASAETVEAELRQAEEHYQKAIAGLERIANSEKGELDPQTAATIEKNLSVVDQAISESRAALRAQPTSEPAQASLLESFKSKLVLLQDTVALINEMRRGTGTAGAARAVSSLKQKGT